MITIKGTLSRITFQNPDTHYTVFKLRVPKVVEPITVVGYLAGVTQGEQLELKGAWTSHPKFGDQFKASTYKVTLPATTEGIRKYLGSGFIQGISTHLADKIVDTFEARTLDIIENDPDQLLNVHGIGQSKKNQIERAWNVHHASRRVMEYLQDTAIGVTHAGTLLKTYGNEALAVLKTDPFRIIRDIPDIGFRAVDQLAGAAGLDREDSNRLAACVICRLMRMARDGHVYADKENLIRSCADMARVDGDAFDPVLEDLSDQEAVVLDGEMVYLKALYEAEAGIARRVGALLSMPPRPCHLDKDQIAQTVLSTMAVRLSDEQMDVVTQVLTKKVSIITGGPGTGKTTLVRALCAVFGHLKLKVVLSAPTGRAARRLSEVTGKTAATLHKLLGFDPDSGAFSRNFANPLDLDLFVVDEASMVDTQLMYRLLEAMPSMGALILVGDTFQLPSVGPGNVLSDMMASHTVAVFSLTEIFRQAQDSPIVVHAHAIRNGTMPDVKGAGPEKASEFYFIENRDPGKVVDTITELCARRIPKAFPHIGEVQVLTPMHRGEAGTINLNQRLQAALNDRPGGIESHGQTFKPGDKVMHLKNNYEKEVFNGDIGRVVLSDNAKGTVVVDYDGRHVAYELLELDELTLAYTISVHKAQGSEYDAVVIALTTAHFPLLQRNLLYTAMTRGRHLVIIVGSSRAFEMAFENDKTILRRSGLKKRMVAISHHIFLDPKRCL